MKKINLLAVIISVVSILACSVNSNTDPVKEPVFKPKLLKKITNDEGYWHRYFYNDNKQIELITQTSNQIDLDSTYFFYNGDVLTKTLQRMYVPVTGVVNTELVYNQFTSTMASGTYKIFTDAGDVYQDKTFEFTFVNNLIKTITFFNLDDTKSIEKIYTHDLSGNLTKFNEVWYNANNTINSSIEHTFSEWDTNGLKTQGLLYWNYRIDNIPNMFVSNSNMLDRNENNQTFRYTFEYDSDGNVTKYTSINEVKYITLEYYE